MNTENQDFPKMSHSETIANEVRNYLPVFTDACLDFKVDILVPIVSEGLALLIPQLLSRGEKIPNVIPSNRFLELDALDYSGKSILIVDVAVFSGNTVISFLKEINTRVCSDSCTRIFFTSLIAREEKRDMFDGEVPRPLFFCGKDYEYAREFIADYLLENIIVRTDDLPLWEISFDSKSRYHLFTALFKLPGFYQSTYKYESWKRYSYCDVQVENSNWLPNEVNPTGLIKIRIFLNQSSNKLKILPLFLPTITDIKSLKLTDFLFLIQKHIGKSASLLQLCDLAKSLGDTLDPKIKYRWVSILGSLLLLEDFIHKLSGSLRSSAIDWSEINLSTQSKLIMRLGGQSCLVNILEQFIRERFDQSCYSKEEQISFHLPMFSFSSYGLPDKDSQFDMTPEELLMAEIGALAAKEDMFDDHTRLSWSFNEIAEKAKFLSPSTISRAIDGLLDEGMLKPSISRRDDVVERVFRLGGEDEKRRFLTSAEILYCMT